ncbi:Uncharacterised protein [Pseudomonas fluorescens]|uniref:Uncharacterized protein n=2 Tax=Pseudomonas fluorescens TaxID=294 RepID=A0A448DXR1_PSEFL|nr:Uncharacterised protein [Pseudomonas fluorescens]
MISTTSTDSFTSSEDDEPARINALFFEADRLEEIAYRLFDESSRNAATWEHFNEAKASADAKRTEAFQAFMALRRRQR